MSLCCPRWWIHTYILSSQAFPVPSSLSPHSSWGENWKKQNQKRSSTCVHHINSAYLHLYILLFFLLVWINFLCSYLRPTTPLVHQIQPFSLCTPAFLSLLHPIFSHLYQIIPISLAKNAIKNKNNPLLSCGITLYWCHNPLKLPAYLFVLLDSKTLLKEVCFISLIPTFWYHLIPF